MNVVKTTLIVIFTTIISLILLFAVGLWPLLILGAMGWGVWKLAGWGNTPVQSEGEQ